MEIKAHAIIQLIQICAHRETKPKQQLLQMTDVILIWKMWLRGTHIFLHPKKYFCIQTKVAFHYLCKINYYSQSSYKSVPLIIDSTLITFRLRKQSFSTILSRASDTCWTEGDFWSCRHSSTSLLACWTRDTSLSMFFCPDRNFLFRISYGT